MLYATFKTQVIAVASPQAKDYAQICVTADEVHVDLSDVTVR